MFSFLHTNVPSAMDFRPETCQCQIIHVLKGAFTKHNITLHHTVKTKTSNSPKLAYRKFGGHEQTQWMVLS